MVCGQRSGAGFGHRDLAACLCMALPVLTDFTYFRDQSGNWGAFGWYDLEQDSPEQRVWLVRPRTGFTRTARLVGTAPVLGRPGLKQTEQCRFFTVKPGENIDFGPK